MKDNSKFSDKKLQQIPLDEITVDAGIQTRAELNNDTLSDYAEAMKSGTKFPPLDVFSDGKSHWLADGFHRLEALRTNGKKQAECNLQNGTRLDAIKFSLGANASHGLRRSNADKRKAVEIALREFPNIADAELARWCAVSQPFVSGVRREAQPKTVIGATRIGGDGKVRHLPPSRPSSAFSLRERLGQLSPDDRLIVEGALCIFNDQGRAVSQHDVLGLIDELQKLGRN